MHVAIVSDIHGNRHAFEAVLDDIAASQADEIWCLGDLVGYGADPNDCVELAREHADLCLAGNHDLAVTGELPLSEFSRGAGSRRAGRRRSIAADHLALLGALEPPTSTQAVGLYHASPRDPVWEYVLSALLAELCLDAQRHRVCAGRPLPRRAVLRAPRGRAGHRRDPPRRRRARHLRAGEWMLNPGSVGQPRDGDPRAAWLLLDTRRLGGAAGGAPSTTSPAPQRRSAPPACPTRWPSACSTGNERAGPAPLDLAALVARRVAAAARRLRGDGRPDPAGSDARRLNQQLDADLRRASAPAAAAAPTAAVQRVRPAELPSLAAERQREPAAAPRQPARQAPSASCAERLQPTQTTATTDHHARPTTETPTPTTDTTSTRPRTTDTRHRRPTRTTPTDGHDHAPTRRRDQRPRDGTTTAPTHGTAAAAAVGGDDGTDDRTHIDRGPLRARRRLGVGGMSTVQPRLRRAPGARRRGQAAGRAPGRRPAVRVALPARGARRRAPGAPQHRPGLRLRPRRAPATALHRHGVRRRATRARRSCATTGQLALDAGVDDRRQAVPRPRLRPPQRRRPPRRQAGQPPARRPTASSSSPTSASPRAGRPVEHHPGRLGARHRRLPRARAGRRRGGRARRRPLLRSASSPTSCCPAGSPTRRSR